jgi:hypothetical protein
MSSSQELYNRLSEKLRELVHVKNGKQVTNWIWVVVGILQSQSSNLSQIANYLPMATKAESRVTKIRRWLMNPQVKVWQFYKAILEQVLSGWSAVEASLLALGKGNASLVSQSHSFEKSPGANGRKWIRKTSGEDRETSRTAAETQV